MIMVSAVLRDVASVNRTLPEVRYVGSHLRRQLRVNPAYLRPPLKQKLWSPDGEQAQRRFIWSKVQKVFNLLVAECSDHCRRETECDRLQHQAFGCMSRFHVDIAASAGSILDRRTLKDRCNADDCRRGC